MSGSGSRSVRSGHHGRWSFQVFAGSPSNFTVAVCPHREHTVNSGASTSDEAIDRRWPDPRPRFIHRSSIWGKCWMPKPVPERYQRIPAVASGTRIDRFWWNRVWVRSSRASVIAARVCSTSANTRRSGRTSMTWAISRHAGDPQAGQDAEVPESSGASTSEWEHAGQTRHRCR